jgi:hypothetical protein
MFYFQRKICVNENKFRKFKFFFNIIQLNDCWGGFKIRAGKCGRYFLGNVEHVDAFIFLFIFMLVLIRKFP